MTTVRRVPHPGASVRAVPVLDEHDLGHYPEFAEFFDEQFGLAAAPFAPPPVLETGGQLFQLVFTGCSGRPFPSGLRVEALVPGLEPMDEEAVDAGLAALSVWLVSGVGGEWNADDLREVGAIYRIPVLARARVT